MIRDNPARTGRTTSLTVSPYVFSRQKRVLDVTMALLILASLIPLLLIVAALVRASSRGPILFRQLRGGVGGGAFPVLKFRSMYHSGVRERGVPQATRRDPRITLVGGFIRRTSIDELPQLINVLRGDMSLIGPRPHALSHDEYYRALIPDYTKRFAARPGLSGLAQVRRARGATPQTGDMERRLAYDLDYIRTASLGTDLRILIATAREMFFSSSAY